LLIIISYSILDIMRRLEATTGERGEVSGFALPTSPTGAGQERVRVLFLPSHPKVKGVVLVEGRPGDLLSMQSAGLPQLSDLREAIAASQAFKDRYKRLGLEIVDAEIAHKMEEISR
jgi:hypothetical protein